MPPWPGLPGKVTMPSLISTSRDSDGEVSPPGSGLRLLLPSRLAPIGVAIFLGTVFFAVEIGLTILLWQTDPRDPTGLAYAALMVAALLVNLIAGVAVARRALATLQRTSNCLDGLAKQQEALRRVATLVARGVEPSEVFGAVANEMRRCMEAMNAGLWRFETSGEMMMLAGSDPALLAKWPLGTRTPIEGNTLASMVLRTRRPARMDEYKNATGAVAERVRAVGVRAAVGVPVIVDGRVWGLAAVGSTRPGPMPADTEERISDFADLVSRVVD
jgi:uncharacterized protein YoaH (UPF0181 family)